MSFVSFIRPNNIAEVRERFFSSKIYNPIFQYSWSLERIAFLRRQKPTYAKLIDAVIRQDYASISHEASLVFETEIHENYLLPAKHILKTYPELPPPGTLRDLEKGFQKAAQLLNLAPYSLRFTAVPGFNFRPRYATKKLEMGRCPSFQLFSIDGELKHEFTHLVRYENGRHNSIAPSPDYLPTEEGLASYFQESAGEYGAAARYQHAAEFCAAQVSLRGSLREVYDFLRDHRFDKELAWQRAIRHKFGFIDTREKGAIMKPAMYFYHAEKVRQLKDEEKLRLLVGKIHVRDLPKYREYNGIVPLESVGRFFGLNVYSNSSD